MADTVNGAPTTQKHQMEFNESRKVALQELTESLNSVSEKEAAEFLDVLLKSRRIFVAAEGRSRLMLQAFAKRLRHLGMESYVAGETVTPPAGKGDLLVAASGSGKTGGVINLVKLAKKYKTDIVFITAAASPPSLKKQACLTVVLAVAPATRLPAKAASRQLMASLFEQTLLLFCDSICLALRDRLKVTNEQMRKRHANLE